MLYLLFVDHDTIRLQIYVRNALMRVIAVVFKRSMSDLAVDDRVVFFQQLESASYQSEQHVCLFHGVDVSFLYR